MSQSSTEALSTLLKSINNISYSISFIPEFHEDTLKLANKFETINNDLKVFIQTSLKLYHEIQMDNGGIKKIKDLKDFSLYKADKFACRSLKGKGAKSGIEVIYKHSPKENKIELIEMYFQEEKQEQDLSRIQKYYQ